LWAPIHPQSAADGWNTCDRMVEVPALGMKFKKTKDIRAEIGYNFL
jgi:hypothetical protein